MTCSPTISSRDKLKLEGLEVVGNDTARHAEGGVTRYAFRYVLTTTASIRGAEDCAVHRALLRRTGGPEARRHTAGRVGAGTGQRSSRFRSLLPDDQTTYPARDERPATERVRRDSACCSRSASA